MVPEREACRCATRWNLEFIDDLLPKLEGGDSLVAAANDHGLEELAEVEFSSSD